MLTKLTIGPCVTKRPMLQKARAYYNSKYFSIYMKQVSFLGLIVMLMHWFQNVMRDDLDKIEPYHCVACGKQYNWELDGTDADLNFIDDDDPESTPLDTLDLAEQVQGSIL